MGCRVENRSWDCLTASQHTTNWDMLNPSELCCTPMMQPHELRCNLLNYDAASCWATHHPACWVELPLNCCAAFSELCCTLLSNAATNWATLYFSNLCCTVMGWAQSYAATYTRLCCTLPSCVAPCWATLHPADLCCTMLSYAEPCWDTLKPLSYAAPHTFVQFFKMLTCLASDQYGNGMKKNPNDGISPVPDWRDPV
jgi:hypothetical protein